MQRKLDLRTGRTVWSAYRAPAVPQEALARDLSADVVVVGMGIGGALAADALSLAGLSVVAIDRRGAVKGSTAATTALVQYEIDQPLCLLSRRIGKERAMRAWRRSRLAVGNLKARILERQIACDLAERPSLYLAGDVLGAEALEEEAELRGAAGLAASFLPRAAVRETYGMDRAALRSQGNLALDPRKLTAGLLLRARERGARFFSPVEAVRFASHADGVAVETKAGPVLSARYVLLATGYELMDFVPAKNHRIISTWAFATARQPAALWKDRALVWEASDPYLYFRATHDGRVICGGEDEDFSDEAQRDALIAEKTERIAGKLKALLPAVDTRPTFAWSGSFGTTTTGLPYVGAVPRRPRIFAVMGYGGNGITYAEIAAELVTAAILGHADPDADLFAF
ncbi:MAG: FAD-binding oxidoreductase [Rhizobiales bacterium]|nr:FAD-binding oxidoreductase [Hyphomicrobiales bacterium]